MTDRTRFRTMAVAIVALFGLVAAACGGGSGGGDDDGGTATPGPGGDDGTTSVPVSELDLDASFSIMTVVVPSSLDPHRTVNPAGIYYWNLLYDRLTLLGDDLRPEPMLATSWEFSESNQVLDIELRDDVVFHDGTPFDADVVVANLDRAQNLEGSTVANELAGLTEVEVISPTEVRLHFDQPRPEMMSVFAGGVGAMMSPAIFDDASIDLQNEAADAGSGAYLVEEYVPSESITLVRAPDENWDPEAGKLARVEIQFVGDDRTRFSALRAGETDAIYVQAGNPNDIAEARALGEEPGFTYVKGSTSVMSALLLRSQLAPTDDLRVRQALNHAIDADAIVDGFLGGACTRTEQMVPEGMAGHISDFEDPYPYDPDEARRLLAEAGLADGFDLDIYTITGRAEIPQIIQEQLQDYGIRVEVTPLASVEVLTSWYQNTIPAWMYQTAASGHPQSTFRGTVFSSFVLGSTDEDLRAAVSAVAPLTGDAADDAYVELFQQVYEDAYFVPLCWFDSHHVVADDVVGFEDALLRSGQFAFDLRHVGRTS